MNAPEAPRGESATRFVARWDLDKTYLRTDFDTLGELVRTAIERPDRKRSVPGAAQLLRELNRSGARIHIVSGSPRQMRGRLEEKLRIDRVRWDEMTLKPNLSNILRLRFSALRDQLGYKLPVLLASRVHDQRLGGDDVTVREALVGDDAEADAFVYSLYADVLGGAVPRAELERVLHAAHTYDDQARRCLDACDRLDEADVVERILIHLDRQSRPSRFDEYGARVVPFYNYLQAAFVLEQDGRIDAEGVLRVASELALRHRFDGDALARSHLDLWRRGHVHRAPVDALAGALERMRDEDGVLAVADLTRMCELLAEYASNPPPQRVPGAPRLDYVELAEKHRGGRNRKRKRG